MIKYQDGIFYFRETDFPGLTAHPYTFPGAGHDLKGYFYWNDADSYEELDGYRLRFGLTWVDHNTGRRRWKNSRYYFSKVCKTKIVN